MEREEDPELKAMYEAEKKKFEELSQTLEGKIDGEITMDMHGNINI